MLRKKRFLGGHSTVYDAIDISIEDFPSDPVQIIGGDADHRASEFFGDKEQTTVDQYTRAFFGGGVEDGSGSEASDAADEEPADDHSHLLLAANAVSIGLSIGMLVGGNQDPDTDISGFLVGGNEEPDTDISGFLLLEARDRADNVAIGPESDPESGPNESGHDPEPEGSPKGTPRVRAPEQDTDISELLVAM